MRKDKSSGGTGSVRSVAIHGRLIGRPSNDKPGSRDSSHEVAEKRRFENIARSTSAAALVVVLAFVVLLTALVLAFFSRAMSERVISNSSASQTKAEIFAQGAVDTIIGDLQQEIVDGSTAYPTATGSVTNTIYILQAQIIFFFLS